MEQKPVFLKEPFIRKENAHAAEATRAKSISSSDSITAYPENSPEFVDYVLSLFSEKSARRDIAGMLLRPQGATVYEINRAVGTTAVNQRISEFPTQYLIHVDKDDEIAMTRYGKSPTVKRHWIREHQQSWWDCTAKKPRREAV